MKSCFLFFLLTNQKFMINYKYNEKTSVVFGNVPYRLYKDKEEIHDSILENAEYCEECIAE